MSFCTRFGNSGLTATADSAFHFVLHLYINEGALRGQHFLEKSHGVCLDNWQGPDEKTNGVKLWTSFTYASEPTKSSLLRSCTRWRKNTLLKLQLQPHNYRKGEVIVWTSVAFHQDSGVISMRCLPGRRFRNCNAELGSCFPFLNLLWPMKQRLLQRRWCISGSSSPWRQHPTDRPWTQSGNELRLRCVQESGVSA